MTAKVPTASGISRLLAAAGFERSDNGRPGVMWNQASTGFSAWKTFLREAPQQPVVAVRHIIKDAHYCPDEEEWRGHLRDAHEMLRCYAADIEMAGWATAFRTFKDDLPWLIVTAKPAALLAAKDGDPR